MDSDWLTGLLVVLMVTIAVGLLWSGTLFGGANKPAPVIIETPAPVLESKENKKKPRQRINPQQSPKAMPQDAGDSKESTALTSSNQNITENLPSRSPRKKKVKSAKRDESSENVDEVTEETSLNDGTWQTQLSRQQKQELLRQRRQQENATQSSSESMSPPEDSIEKQIASAANEVVTASSDEIVTTSNDETVTTSNKEDVAASNDDSKTTDQLMYLENNSESDAWLVINEENSSS